MAKSLLLAYIFWAVGGTFGLHHFYLRRDKHAFVWWTTFGGWLLGWALDFFKLPRYVEESHVDDEPERAYSRRPATLNIGRCFGAVALGSFYGLISRVLIPEDLIGECWYLVTVAKLLSLFGVSLGVYLVFNIGREKASFFAALKGALLVGLPTMFSDESYLFHVAIAAVLSVLYSGIYYVESPRRRPPLCGRCMRFSCGISLYSLVLITVLLFNVKIISETGEEVPLRTAAYNFLHSEAWRETKSTGWYLYNFWMKHGWDDMFDEMKYKFDTSGVGRAHEVLEVTTSMSEEEMTRQYRSLSRKWHPDKFRSKSDEERKFAETRFVEIQSAWEKISSVKTKREVRNRRSRRDEL